MHHPLPGVHWGGGGIHTPYVHSMYMEIFSFCASPPPVNLFHHLIQPTFTPPPSQSQHSSPSPPLILILALTHPPTFNGGPRQQLHAKCACLQHAFQHILTCWATPCLCGHGERVYGVECRRRWCVARNVKLVSDYIIIYRPHSMWHAALSWDIL